MADTIRFGKVSNINYETGCMEIVYEDREDSVTDMIPMLANAGYKMPKVGAKVKNERCLVCHQSYEALAERTKALNPNPHKTHLGNVRCTDCHAGHQQGKLMCNDCHKFNLTVK